MRGEGCCVEVVRCWREERRPCRNGGALEECRGRELMRDCKSGDLPARTLSILTGRK